METPVAAFGTDMTLKGQAMKLPRKVNAQLVVGQGAGTGACVVNHNINNSSNCNSGSTGNNGSRNQIPSANTSTRTSNSQKIKERSSKKITSDSDDEDEESEEESGICGGPSVPRSSGVEDFSAPLRDRDSPGKMRGKRRSIELYSFLLSSFLLSSLLLSSPSFAQGHKHSSPLPLTPFSLSFYYS
jgi:hypothetical protein